MENFSELATIELMPNDNLYLKTEVNFFATAVIVDQIGEVSTHLVDHLLNHGCLVGYFGKEDRSCFDYLDGKSNFVYFDNLSKLESLGRINYLVVFLRPDGNRLEEILERQGGQTKVLFVADTQFKESRKLWEIISDNRLNGRVAFYDEVFGPRVRSGFLGEIFSDCFKKDRVSIEEVSGKNVWPVYAPKLAKELIRLLFSPDTKNKSFFIASKKMEILSFIGLLQKSFASVNFDFTNKERRRLIDPARLQKLEIESFLREEVEETIEWFRRSTHQLSQSNEEEIKEKIETAIKETKEDGEVEEMKNGDKKEDEKKEAGGNLKGENSDGGGAVAQSVGEKKPGRVEGVVFDSVSLPLVKDSSALVDQRGEEQLESSLAVFAQSEDKLDFLYRQVTSRSDESSASLGGESEIDKRGEIRSADLPASQESKSGRPVINKPTSLAKKLVFGLSLFFLLVFFSFISPFLFTAVLGVSSVRDLKLAQVSIEAGEFNAAITRTDSVKKKLALAEKTLFIFAPFYGLIKMEKPVDKIVEVFSFSQNLNDALSYSLLGAGEGVGLSRAFINGRGSDWPETLSAIKANLSLAYKEASLAQSSLDKAEPGFTLFGQEKVFDKIREFLPETREILLKGQKLLAIAPEVIALEGRKTYLLLFQNNMEIRPTGGFIGSYAIISIEKGKLIDFKVYDVYQADGQMKGHVEPPETLKKYLGEAAWYLRDSNWDPDYPVSARRAQWFLDKEMQITVDGTIALTLETAKNVLAVLGEVIVPEYEEKITKDNLFQKAEYYSELGTFPGSTQKKDFLGSLAKAIFERIRQAEGKEMVNIAGAIFASLEHKETLVYFNDQEAQEVIASLNWDGALREPRPNSNLESSVLVDYLHINEANVGINKANFFVKRDIDHQVFLEEDGRVKEKLTITYDNQSPTESWPAGRYKTFLRIYLPRGANLSSILVSDSANANLWTPYNRRHYEVSEEGGKSVHGFLVEVPIMSQKRLEINYELPKVLAFDQKVATYLFVAQKQPGAFPSNYSYIFSYPPGVIPLRVIPSAVVGDNQLLVSQQFTRDLIIQVDLAR